MSELTLRERYINKQRDLSHVNSRPPFPRIVKIDICNTCNYACVFCPQSKQSGKVGNIDDALCKKIIIEAYDAGAREICLSSTGEPLLNPNLGEYIRFCKKLGYEYVFFNTNGFQVTNEKASDVLRGRVSKNTDVVQLWMLIVVNHGCGAAM